MDDATDLTVNSGATYIAGSSDAIGSIFGAGTIDIGLNFLDIKGGSFSGTLSADKFGKLTKSGTDTLTLLGNNSSSFFGYAEILSGETILTDPRALGGGSLSSPIQVSDGAS